MASYVLNFTRGGTKDKKGMPAQALKLLHHGLWGIPPTAKLKDKIAPGDRIIAFVGAPDRVFVADAVVQNGYHPWTPAEAATYAALGTFDHGLSLTEVRLWPKQLPLMSVWPQTQQATTNPKALWYGAIAALSTADADAIISAGINAASTPSAPIVPASTPSAPKPQPIVPTSASGSASIGSTTASQPKAPGLPESEALFAVGEKLKKFLANPKPISEDGTRALFINRILEALGYVEIDDVEFGSAQASGTVPDYVLHAGGQGVMAVEAKKIGFPLGEKEASQLVSYCSVVSVRWGLLTDGRLLLVYDAPVVGVAPADRLVLSIDLAHYVDRDDFDTRLWPAAAMMSKEAMTTGADLERHAARELIRTLLAQPSSASVKALQKELQARKVVVSTEETVALLADLIG